MKSTLGKLFFTLLLMNLTLCAQSELAEYQLSTSTSNPYLKEAVKITFTAIQKDKSDIMFFFLEPKKSSKYKIILLNKDAKKLAYHHKKTTFTYLLFPLQDGDITVDFDFTIKVASDKAVAQVYEGSRDNVKWIETTNTKVVLNPLHLKAKALKGDVDLIGDFHITSSLDKNSITSYESVNIKYTLTGIGYDNFTINPIGIIMGVDIFSDISKHYESATHRGYKIQREYNYALLAKSDINVKPVTIKCYSPSKEKYYNLTTKEYKIKVKRIKTTELVDKVNYPQKSDFLTPLKTLFTYIMIFLAGYLSAKFSPTLFKRKELQYRDISESNSPKALLYLLMHKYPLKDLEVHYEALNDIVYNNAKRKNFNKIKKAVLDKLKKK